MVLIATVPLVEPLIGVSMPGLQFFSKATRVILICRWNVWLIHAKFEIWIIHLFWAKLLFVVILTVFLVVGQCWRLSWRLMLKLGHMKTWMASELLLLILLSHQFVCEASLIVLVMIWNWWAVFMSKDWLLLLVIDLVLSMRRDLSSSQWSSLSSVYGINCKWWSIRVIIMLNCILRLLFLNITWMSISFLAILILYHLIIPLVEYLRLNLLFLSTIRESSSLLILHSILINLRLNCRADSMKFTRDPLVIVWSWPLMNRIRLIVGVFTDILLLMNLKWLLVLIRISWLWSTSTSIIRVFRRRSNSQSNSTFSHSWHILSSFAIFLLFFGSLEILLIPFSILLCL